jgi:hypothetical protein
VEGCLDFIPDDRKLQAFLIFSAKLEIKGKTNGKEWCEIIGTL